MANFVELINIRTAKSLGKEITIASTFRERFVGLLGRSGISHGQGLLIERCNQVHMLFMRFEIGILFLASDMRIVGIQSSLKPWQVSSRVADAAAVLELPVGVVESADCQIGDRLIIC